MQGNTPNIPSRAAANLGAELESMGRSLCHPAEHLICIASFKSLTRTQEVEGVIVPFYRG